VIKDGVTESRTLVQEKRAHCMFEWVYFSRTDSTIEKVSVYEARLRLGNALASEWEQEADVIVPVPDTARAAAQGFSEATGIPLREGLIKNRYLARSFIMPSQEAREMMVRLKLNPIISELRGKSVALVDDSIVRGTTSKRLVQQVRAAGAREVHFVVSCPPIRHPCFYGIDMCREDELIARTKAPAEIAKELGADSVTYQGIDGLRKAIGIDGLCTACLNGEYPTDCSAMLSRQGQGCRPYEAE
jgi:amidophosphoribosyltransferase